MIVLTEVGFDFVFSVDDFAFEKIEAKESFQPVVGESGFADRQTSG